MADKDKTAVPATAERVVQVERRDYPEIAPEGATRTQSLDGFDPVYADIVDYIVRCTHKIWDERDIGLIYSHYTHNCVLYGTTGTIYNREDIVRDTIQRLVSFPERRGMATHVIWKGNDRDGFYTSHLVTGSGRHTQNGHLGRATGRPFVSRTIADCMILRNKIYREWVVADTTAIMQQLGLDIDAWATRVAETALAQGRVNLDIGENRLMIGQYAPESDADTSIAATETERHTLRWLHDVYNRKMFGTIARVYAPGVSPPDFHAVCEVFLNNEWHLVDATGMATAGEMAKIGVGRDAADVAFLTSFGPAFLQQQQVSVDVVGE